MSEQPSQSSDHATTGIPLLTLTPAAIAQCQALLTEGERQAARNAAAEVWGGKLAATVEISAALLALSIQRMLAKHSDPAESQQLVNELYQFVSVRVASVFDEIETTRHYAVVGHG